MGYSYDQADGTKDLQHCKQPLVLGSALGWFVYSQPLALLVWDSYIRLTTNSTNPLFGKLQGSLVSLHFEKFNQPFLVGGLSTYFTNKVTSELDTFAEKLELGNTMILIKAHYEVSA